MRTFIQALSVATAAVTCASCGPGSRSPIETVGPSTITDATLRMIASDTTWVVRGPGYELVARTVRDLGQVRPELDRQARLLREMFAEDPATVTVTVNRLTSDGRPARQVPLPTETPSTVVEVFVGDASSDRGGRASGAGRGRTPPQGMGTVPGAMMAGRGGSPTGRVVRSWLAAHARSLTASAATARSLSGDVPDARVKPWVEYAVDGASADSQVTDRLVAQLAAQKDSLYPLSQLFLMQQPPVVQPQRMEDMGRRGGEPGGMGGRGGTGGGRGAIGGSPPGGMGGRGGMGGGRGGTGGPPTARPAILQGAALYIAQAMVLGSYLVTRESPAFLGAIVNAQMKGEPIDEVLTSATRILARDFESLELDWRRWLEVRARDVKR